MIRIFLIILLSALSLYLYSELQEMRYNLETYKDLSCPIHDGKSHTSSTLNLGTKEFSCYYAENIRKTKTRR